MTPKISVLVQVDVCDGTVTLGVTGQLTEGNQQALVSLVRRARSAFPRAAVTVDLVRAEPVSAAAVDLLVWSLEMLDAAAGPVTLRIPPPDPTGSRGTRAGSGRSPRKEKR
ncbi:hypothetical protein [Kocuria turfanensis]|uniref:STAS domain-containing protein n=1 Tax=Kocuria turfanensis TaxID=388357 RepID=A0A512ICK0_9MICC|nr:hypothetical protein [Kocuria turfanensis]GEO95408.1 hypothetical protein KTU01_15310 [Kocuria turfanensis]